MIITVYKDIEISVFHWLAVKLSLKEGDNLHTSNL